MYRICRRELKTQIITHSTQTYPLHIAEAMKRDMAALDPGAEYWLEEVSI